MGSEPRISEALAEASKLRVPRGPFSHPTERITAYEDYTLDTAYHQAELAAERLELYDRLRDLEVEWDSIEPVQRRKTDRGVDEAKAQIAPKTWEAIGDLRWRVQRLSEEIERLERDATKLNRVHRRLTGA